jgi:hypothetical protein
MADAKSPNTSVYRLQEWHARHVVMEATLRILADGKPHTSRQILDTLLEQGFTIPKRLVNSILFSEAKRYVKYDKKTFTYQLRQVEVNELDSAIDKIDTQNTPITTTRISSEQVQGEIKATLIGKNDEYTFSVVTSTGPIFFDISVKGRRINILLNEAHPITKELDEMLHPITDLSEDQLKDRAIKSQKTLELLLAAWAKYESELPTGRRKHKAEEFRADWGRNVRILADEGLDDEA